jgi:MFS transporter, Spinster family, sphingosine-1-phosphate transporter
MSSPSTVPPAASGAANPTDSPARGAYFALAVLFSMNLLNYVDRYVFAAVGESIKNDLNLTDFKYGILAGSFMVVYTILSPVIGWMGDRYSRRKLLAFGVGLWSVATVGTTFSKDFYHMCAWRALLGVGEASYGIVAPTLLADLFPRRLRGRVMGAFYLALPLGGALGYVLGGAISDSKAGDQFAGWMVGLEQGWRTAFLVVGLPGLLAAVGGLFIHDPGRGASEGHKSAGKADRPKLTDYVDLFKTRSYLYNMAGMAAVTFTTGAYGVFGSLFYQRVRGMKEKEAALTIGVLTAVAGLLGIALGMWLPDKLQKKTRRAYLLWAAAAVLIAVPFGGFALLIPVKYLSMVLLFVAMFMLAATLGPCNTIPANVIPANQRAAAYAFNIFMIHLLGDISSPLIIGRLSDWIGSDKIATSWLGQFLGSLGANPVLTKDGPTNLTAGMLLVIPVLILGSFFFLFGSRSLPDDQERARKLSGPSDFDDLPMH